MSEPTHIPINKPPLIFNDPKFCRGELNKDGKCDQLKWLKHLSTCRLFKVKTGMRIDLAFDQEKGIEIKCDECKAAWREATERNHPGVLDLISKRKPGTELTITIQEDGKLFHSNFKPKE